MIEIPQDRLSSELLIGIIEEFIQREGTDYGANEASLGNKIQQVKKQIERGEVVVTFDQLTESCNLLTRADFKRHQIQEQIQEQKQDQDQDQDQGQQP